MRTQVNLKTAGEIGVDGVEKSQEVLIPMPLVSIADGNSGGHIQRREQRRNSMALVIMRVPAGRPSANGRNRLGAVERLDWLGGPISRCRRIVEVDLCTLS